MNKGLLKKEFYNLKFNLIIYAVILISFLIESLITCLTINVEETQDIISTNILLNNLGFLITSIGYFSTLLISSFSMDEQSRWNIFLISEGIDRKSIIKGKYLLNLIFTLVVSIFSLFSFIAFIKYYSFDISISYTLSIFLTVLLAGMLGGIIDILIFIKFGVGKGVVLLFLSIIISLIPLGILFLFNLLLNTSLSSLNESFILLFTFINFIIGLIIIFFLYKLTLKTFNKKEY